MDEAQKSRHDSINTVIPSMTISAGRVKHFFQEIRVWRKRIWYYVCVADNPTASKTIVVKVSRFVADQIEKARSTDSVSLFVRKAIKKELDFRGFNVADKDILAPDRKGKGGRKPKG